MSSYLKVTNAENNLVWKKTINSDEEFRGVHDYFNKGKTTVSWIQATLYPVRTNHLKNFATDLFFPTMINHALKIQNFISKIFVIIAAALLDLITLPIRLITAIPRAIMNYNQKPIPLFTYLKGQGVDPKLLGCDRVFVRLSSDCEYAPPVQQEQGPFLCVLKAGRSWQKRPLNFIEVPYYEEFITGGIKDRTTKEHVISYKPRIV